MSLDRALGTRLLWGMAIMSILLVAIAVSGRLGMRHMKDTTQEVLVRDTHVSEEAIQTRVAALLLRRYEKDYFLNIGSATTQEEYFEKWKAARETAIRRLDTLDKLVPSEEDHATLRDMRADLEAYLAGFEKVAAKVRSGAITTPQAANAAMGEYKDTVRRLDATTDAIGGASDIKMDRRIALLDADTSRTNRDMSIIALLAIGVAALIGLRLRSAMRETATA
jgi:methyl-accepting chemotaxis protein